MQNNLSKEEKDYLRNILQSEKEQLEAYYGSSAIVSIQKIDNIIKKLNLKETHLNK
jgi:hypothetical protein